jgi:hypothetical protein
MYLLKKKIHYIMLRNISIVILRTIFSERKFLSFYPNYSVKCNLYITHTLTS